MKFKTPCCPICRKKMKRESEYIWITRCKHVKKSFEKSYWWKFEVHITRKEAEKIRDYLLKKCHGTVLWGNE